MGAGALSGDISGTLRKMLGIPNDFFYSTFKEVLGKHAFGLVPILMRPKSRGRLKLRSLNPFHWPIMQPNYFKVKSDLEQMREGVKLALQIADTASFAKFGTRFHDTPFRGCEQFPFKSDPYFECCIRRFTSSLQHQVGTCRMGPASDSGAVVDSRLRVHGVRRLRVVDASIMPVLPAAHTNAVVYMIGEKAADMIKGDWKREQSNGV